MTLKHREISIEADGIEFAGRLSWDDQWAEPRPGLLVCHTIRGRTGFEEQKAEDLAGLGYAALAVDLYGTDSRGSDIDALRAHMDALKADRPGLQARLGAWLDALRSQPEVDSGRTGAIGFCFGGLCALDIARSGADVAGVVSFHGLFDPPGNTAGKRIRAKVLALHGWDDPLATPEQVLSLAVELTEMGADWQIHGYGNTVHAFTNPAADDRDAGTVYNAIANRRSWAAMTDFLAEVFGN